MIRNVIIALFVQLSVFVYGQSQTGINKKGDKYYVNPIFSGDYADPSILREGDDYYIVHSSFEYYPGLLIWHSKDLINWTPVATALHKYVGSVWAPDLVKYNNKYYIYFPANATNYVVTADSMNGPWSEPIDLKVNNIDPGRVTDKDGKHYLYFSGGGYVPLSEDGLSVIGEIKYTYSGWPIPREWSVECSCLESPKLVKRGDYYYLTMAQGGTAGPATSHMMVSARSKSPLGPWENSPYNPIVHTNDIAEKWWSKGHGTLFEDEKGKWWIVYHAYENGHYNMGRQTLLEPVEWTKDGWFKTPDGINADEPIKRPVSIASKTGFTLNDSFDGRKLKPQWGFFGEYDTTRFHIANNSLEIKAKGKTVGDCSPLALIPLDHSYEASVEVYIEGQSTGGLVLFYNNKSHYGILADNENIMTDMGSWQFQTEKKVIKNHVFLRLINKNDIVDMYYSADGVVWYKTENSVEVSSLNHNALGGFFSLRLGLCSMGDGTVRFKNFTYRPIK